jgi:hypothetical protein
LTISATATPEAGAVNIAFAYARGQKKYVDLSAIGRKLKLTQSCSKLLDRTHGIAALTGW